MPRLFQPFKVDFKTSHTESVNGPRVLALLVAHVNAKETLFECVALPIFRRDVICCHSLCSRRSWRTRPLAATSLSAKCTTINHSPFTASNTLLEPNRASNEHLDTHQSRKHCKKCQMRYLRGESFDLVVYFFGLAVVVPLLGGLGWELQLTAKRRLLFGFY